MNIAGIPTGSDVPHEINVIVEIPLRADPVKYEIDKATGAMWVDRFINTAMYYPTNYGYVPHTLSEDGDPADVLVVAPLPLITGSVVSCRPVGLLVMADEKGPDSKILAVPADRVCTLYRDVHGTDDLPPLLLLQIQHFFEHYKDLEKGKWVRVEGWRGLAEAEREIVEAVERFRRAPVKPAF